MADPISLVVSPIIDTVLENVTSVIKQELFLVTGIKEAVETLSSSLTTIQGVLEDAEEKQLTDTAVKDWLRKLKNTALDAEDILDTYKTEAYLWRRKQQARKVRFPISKSQVAYKRDAAQKIQEISTRFEKIAKEKQDFHLDIKVDNGSSRPENRYLPLPDIGFFRETSDVQGREDDKNKIIDKLLLPGDDLSVVPIIGMGGLGKTTLAQLIVSDKRIEDHFQFKMWVCVTINFNLTRILREMIEFHSKMQYDQQLSISQLQSRLLEFLGVKGKGKEREDEEKIGKGKRFLLILDDVWTENYEKWEQLRGILQQGAKGSRVLVTSRSTRVSDVMGTEPPYLLPYLPEDNCRSLFEKIAFKSSNSLSSGVQKDLEGIGREIVHKCNGLPLAVKAMGGLLRGNVDVSKWRRILQNDIWRVEEQNSKTDKPTILPALKLSYDHLPSNLKQCFVYCSIFPKAYVYDKDELVKLWIAEAFIIQSRAGQESLEEIGKDHFNELFVRSFFQLSNVENKEKYRMHDLIHDLAQSISSPHCCQVKEDSTNLGDTTKDTRHLSLHGKDVDQTVLKVIDKSKKLRTLQFPTEHLKNFGQTTLDKLFRTLRYIRMLDLSSSTISELPETVEELKLLRYLDLSKTEIRLLPDSTCNLSNLQTLKLLGCLSFFELPRDTGNLTNLRHLELDEMFWYKSKKTPPSLGRLTSLHNLHAFRVGLEKGYGIDELKDMVYLTGTLHISGLENVFDDHASEAKLREKQSLHKVVFEWSNTSDSVDPQAHESVQEKVLEDLQPHSNVKELKICHYRGSTFPHWVREGLLQNLGSISLNYCTKCKILSLGQLSNLRQLCFKGMKELEEWPEAEFPSIDTLKISNCPKLKVLPPMIPSLRVLKIKRCESLKALPVTPSLQFLILVDNPVLEDWHEVIVHFFSVNDQGQLEAQNARPSLISLLELKIMGCNKLKALPKFFAPQKLEISGCVLLSALPVPDRAQRLQHLALGSCHDGTLVRAIPSTNSLYSLVISGISNLVSLPNWPHLPGLKALYIRDCEDLVSLSEGEEGSLQSLTSLQLLSIRNCPKLEKLSSLPTTLQCLTIGSCPNLKSLGPKKMLKDLTSLKDLYVEDCPTLPSLTEERLSNDLQHLHIQGCPLLTERCQKENGGGQDWPNIMHIPDLEIDYNNTSLVLDGIEMPCSKPSPTWFRHFICGKGVDIKEAGEPHSLMQRDKGNKLKGNMTVGESSSSASPRL